MQTCGFVNDFCLRYCWPPWENGGKGLVAACVQGRVRYYTKWDEVSRAMKRLWEPPKQNVLLEI